MGQQPLIVVLPGIGGSVLARPGEPDEDAVWDASKSEIAKGALHPGRLDIDEPLEPRRLTESTKFLGITLVPGYELLLSQLEEFGTVDRRGDPNNPMNGAAVVAVPYDFRHSIVAAAERLDAVVCAHLDGASDDERAKRVIVVAHSMGGLVARVWLGLLGRWPWCRSLITLGTPHRGAPKILMPLARRSRVNESRCRTGHGGHFSPTCTYSRLRRRVGWSTGCRWRVG